MTNGVAVPAAARPTRGETKAESRRRLLTACLELIETDGPAGLTTGKVARRAGLAQPTFYVHFADMEDLFQSLLTEVLDGWGAATIEARRMAWEDPGPARFRETFRVPMVALAAHPQALRVVLANRHDPTSTIGRWSAEMWERHRRDLIDDLRRGGFPARSRSDRRRTEMIADGIIALTTEMVLGHVDGRYPDLDEAIDVLVAFASGHLQPYLGPIVPSP